MARRSGARAAERRLIHILVCGDPDRNRLMVLWGGYVSPVTKKMTFAATA